MISQENISETTPMGATLAADGATFRVWAPHAESVYLNGVFSGQPQWNQTDTNLMARDANGFWSGFVAGATDGDVYKFYVTGLGSSGYKRDPYARELSTAPPYPD